MLLQIWGKLGLREERDHLKLGGHIKPQPWIIGRKFAGTLAVSSSFLALL